VPLRPSGASKIPFDCTGSVERVRWRILTALFVAIGVGIGVVAGGVGGLFLGGVVGYLVGSVGALRSRLGEVERAHTKTRRIVGSQRPPATPEGASRTDESLRAPPESTDLAPPPEPAPQLGPFPRTQPADRRVDTGSVPAAAHRTPATSEPESTAEPPGAPTGPRTGESEPVGSEPVDAEAVESEAVDAEPVGSEAVEPESVAAATAAGAGGWTSGGPVAPYRPPVSVGSKLLDALKRWLTTGNAPVKVGAVILLIGVGFLIREAGRRGIFTLTIEVRLIAVAVFAVIVGAFGWRQRERRPIYGRSLQGVSIAALYLTTYASFEVYDLIPTAVAAAAVILVTVAAGALAVTQDARVLAVLGIIGGFGAPVLAYDRPDDYVVVFSFYTVLSVAIVGVAWFKTWPSLNLLGLAFNVGIAAFWLLNRYAEEDWASLQPFIAAFVLIYMGLPVLFAVREPPSVRALWTAPLVFTTPFLGLGLQQLVVGHTARGVAISALVLMGLLVALHVVARRLGPGSRELAVAYAGLSVAFAAIAVPLWLDAYYMTLAWAVQGAVLVWFGCRRGLLLSVAGGAVLQVLAAASFVVHLVDALPYPEGRLVILNEFFAAAVLLALTGVGSAWLLHRAAQRANTSILGAWAALAWGLAWWFTGGLLEIAYQVPSWPLPASYIFVVVSCSVAVWAASRVGWPHLGALGFGVVPLLGLVLLAWASEVPSGLDRHGAAAVLAVCGLASAVLFQRNAARTAFRKSLSWVALVWGVGWWLAGGLLEISYRLPSWQLPVALAFVASSLGVAASAAERARWPQLNALGVLILPMSGVVLGLSIVEVAHPLGRYGWAAWPVALAAHYWFLRLRDDVLGVLRAGLHAGGFWLLAVLVGAEVHWQVGRVAGEVWMPVAALGAVLLLVALTLRARRGSMWPFGAHGRVYVAGGIGPVLIAAAIGLFIMILLLDGDPAPFHYVPVFNPLEMSVAPLLAISLAWRRAAAAAGDHALRRLVDSRWAPTLAPAGVVVATMSVARTIHHWRDEPWEFAALAGSTEFQAALSIVWAAIALTTMVIAVRLARRAMWMAGASFMGLVVVKLFFVDLSSLGAVTRVVSFLGVGALLVVVGYFAPVVPAARVEAED